MIDGSFLKYEDTVTITKKVVAIAHPKEVSVEAELGKLAGVEERSVEEKEAMKQLLKARCNSLGA